MRDAAGRIDKSAAIPLYHQIYTALRESILSGERPHGSTLPTEADLARRHGVSRITARRALDELARDKLALRRRRVGTTVNFTNPIFPIQADIHQAVESLLVLGRNTRVQLIEREEGAAGPAADALCVSPEDSVVRAVRIRWLDDEPLGRITSFMPLAVGRGFGREALESQPVLGLLEGAGHRIGRASQTIAAVAADAELSAALIVELRAPLLKVTRTVFDEAGAPLLLTIAHYRADRYQVTLELS